MLTHDDIWKGIDRLAAQFGYSSSGLAKKAGLDPTSFNRSKRSSADGKPRWPSTESLARILAVTGTTMSDFIALIEEGNKKNKSGPRRIPVIGLARAGRGGCFDDSGYPAGREWEAAEFPGAAEFGGHVYALQVTGNSMEPLYRAGDHLIVDPASSVRRGDRIVVCTAGGEVMAKELSRRNADMLELRSLNPAAGEKPITLKTGDIRWMARILWVSQ